MKNDSNSLARADIHACRPQAEPSSDWALNLPEQWVYGTSYTTFNSSINAKATQNLKLLLTYHPDIQHRLAYNIFAQDIMVIAPLPWDGANWQPRMLQDTDIVEFQAWQGRENGLFRDNEKNRFNFDYNTIKRMVVYVAKQSLVNPPRDYYESLKWDGTPRLEYWLHDLLGAEQSDYTAFVGKKWLIAAVSRIYKPGTPFDHCLILEGKQRIGKSKTLERLATFNGERYFHDEALNFSNKEDAILCQGKLIIEMAELASWRKADNNAIKMFITRTHDRFRGVWAEKAQDHPRMYILAGTINPDGGGYFTDDENTRYWPVKCGDERIDLEAVSEARDQLWAEAVHCYKQGEKIHLTLDEEELARAQQQQRETASILQEDIEKAIERILYEHIGTPRSDTFSISEIMTKLDVPKWQKNNRGLGSEIRRELIKAGYQEIRRNNARRWGRI